MLIFSVSIDALPHVVHKLYDVSSAAASEEDEMDEEKEEDEEKD